MKAAGEKIAMVTAYDYPSALLADGAGIDVLLVGDSLGMVVLGYSNPVQVTVDDIVHHTRPVARAARRALVVADMPFMSYHLSREQAVGNAARLIQEGGADAVKLEGGKEMAHTVKEIVDVGIPVQAHIGLMPQRASVGDTFKVQGKTAETAQVILEDALALEEAGAFSVVLEFVTAEAAKLITELLEMPTIGIGSGPGCDGQVLILHDVLGVYDQAPPFTRPYADLNKVVTDALARYRDDVRSAAYPGEEHTVHMDSGEAKKLKRKRT
ncbi:3-methyl-2-oxobutanoate hydroxymethyltransferase [Candidatus Bathyarchaeota archaeon RBG_16_57_9]|nr:MAG: 3-methyl-2-oxobutanoate hydroxymethyltransferase [Candidatus Bathyarchaeota archaeon RBG_16_57_9]